MVNFINFIVDKYEIGGRYSVYRFMEYLYIDKEMSNDKSNVPGVTLYSAPLSCVTLVNHFPFCTSYNSPIIQ